MGDRLVLANCSEATIRRRLFLPPCPHRKAEGGLRFKGYFKRALAEKPVVTVVTIVYNGVEHIVSTIESVLGQSYSNIEYIVVDGGSTDGTVDAIRKYEHAIDYWVSEPDRGLSDAFNKGVITSTGQWLNFMNCADTFAAPDAVEHFIDHIEPSADIMFGRGSVVDSDGRILLTVGKVFQPEKFSRWMSIPHQSAFHNYRYFHEYGLFDRNLETAMVYELLLRKASLSAVFFDKTVSHMLMGGVHEAADYRRLREYRMVKRTYCSKLSRFTIEYDYLHALARALVKRGLIHLGLGLVVSRFRRKENRRW